MSTRRYTPGKLYETWIRSSNLVFLVNPSPVKGAPIICIIFCMFSVNIDYPKQAYITYLLIMRQDKKNFFLPLYDLYADFEPIEQYVRNFIAEMKIKKPEIFIPPMPIVFPLSFSSNVRLKKEYWDKPTLEYTWADRINSFHKVLENYQFYQLLVTPVAAGKSISLQVSHCFQITAQEPEISLFLSMTFMSMDMRAKNAALYRFGNPVRFEYESGKKIKV